MVTTPVTFDHKIRVLNPAGCGIQFMTLQCFIAESVSLPLFNCLDIIQ